MTRLKAEPPLIQFNTFEMLQDNNFNTYTRRTNLETFSYASDYNISELTKLHADHGRVITHEAIPVVSELWVELMWLLRPYNYFQLNLNLLKTEISPQMWKYIENTAMLPQFGQEFEENISTILNIHMNICNKSAILLNSQTAITLHIIQKQMNKPSFFVNDKIHENFWGYEFVRYFPTNLLFRVRYLFDSGVFEWWQRYFYYSLVLKSNHHAGKTIPKIANQTVTSENGKTKTAVTILSLIPGVGLLISVIVLIVEHCSTLTFYRKIFVFSTNCLNLVKSIYRFVVDILCRSVLQRNNVILINLQPSNIPNN